MGALCTINIYKNYHLKFATKCTSKIIFAKLRWPGDIEMIFLFIKHFNFTARCTKMRIEPESESSDRSSQPFVCLDQINT